MSDRWTDRLSEYLDGELKGSERAMLEAHLERCEDCQQTLAGLRRVVMRARSLEERPPATDLWAGVAERIGAPTRPTSVATRRRFTFSVPQLLAAGVTLAVLSGSGAWMLHPNVPSVALQQPAAPGDVTVTPVAAPSAVQSYDAAVGDLERVLEQGRGRLDTATVRVLEQNLAIIDRAIADARRAVAADSANVYLNTHLAETMRRKVDLLRQAAALVAAVS
ncbi:MAG TPA: anti-sigma factor [Gemmatimonadales bacterium]|jgi:anti-sigma factor RsiW